MPDETNRGPRALLIAPDLRMAGELQAVLARETPGGAVSMLDTYPDRGAPADPGLGAVDLCFLDVTSDAAAAFGVLAWLGSRYPAAPVVTLLGGDDPDLILSCLRQGASEFLVRPFTPDQLHAALAKLSRLQGRSSGESGGPRGRLFCVMPAKGACGATSVACNLAFALKRLLSAKVLLADLDGLTGTVAFLLKLRSQYSFMDALNHSSTLDADLWKALVAPCHGIDVLLSPENPVESMGQSWDPAPLLDSSRRMYPAVVVDAGGAYGDWNLALARLCDELLLVATSELPALYAAERATAYLARNGVERPKIRAVVNRAHAGIDRSAIEKKLGLELLEVLPSDYGTMQKSLMEGKPAPSGSGFGRSVLALARSLEGRGCEAKKNGGLLTSLLARLGR